MSDSDLTLGDDLIRQLAESAIAGDRGALERLLWHYHAHLLEHLQRKVGRDWAGKIDPDDVLQDALCDAFADIGRFTWQGDDSLYHWLRRIVDHRFLDQVRRWRSRKRDTQREVHGGAGSQFASLVAQCAVDSARPSGPLRQADAERVLMTALAQLPEDVRDAVRRYYLANEPVDAIAASLARSDHAVRRLLVRGLEALRQTLGRASRFLESHG